MGKHNNKKKNPSAQKIERYLLNIVILVHGRFDLLAKCLQALPEAAKDTPYNVILVDNASPDKAEADAFYGSLHMDNVVITRNKENFGFPKGCNQGFRRGYAPLVMFLNSDVMADPGSINTLVRDMDDPQNGAIGMKLVFPDDAEGLPQDKIHRPAGMLQHIGLMTNIRGEFIHVFLGWDAEHPKVNAMRHVYAVTGAAMITRRSLFNKAGLFYEGYGKGTYEDVDYCLKVREMGYNIVVNPSARGIHYTGATAEKYKEGFPLDFNRLIFLQRWGGKLAWSEWSCL
jgi:GT2 family glycosyltransferase